MKKALEVINELLKAGLFKTYAIGGGIACIYYIEPALTWDIDIFFITAKGKKGLTQIYEWLETKGYKRRKEQIVIEGMPVHFIPIYNELSRESVKKAIQITFQGITTKIIKVEHLLAMKIERLNSKDREWIYRIQDQAKIEKSYLNRILKKYNLNHKFKEFIKQNES